MENKKVLAIVVPWILSSGCAARSGGRWQMSPRFSLTPPILTVVVTNNTVFPLSFSENGEPVMVQNPQTKEWKDAYVLPGGTVSRAYYVFIGSRQIVLTARAICPAGGLPPKPGQPNTGCNAGDYAGTESRTFYLYSGSDYRAENWMVNNLQAPRGSY